jgi:hypothetical protein
MSKNTREDLQRLIPAKYSKVEKVGEGTYAELVSFSSNLTK